jgi:hypothetical protein
MDTSQLVPGLLMAASAAWMAASCALLVLAFITCRVRFGGAVRRENPDLWRRLVPNGATTRFWVTLDASREMRRFRYEAPDSELGADLARIRRRANALERLALGAWLCTFGWFVIVAVLITIMDSQL